MEEVLRKNQRALTRAMEGLDLERQKMKQQEQKSLGDMKKMAKPGQMDAVKNMAKDVVHKRRYMKKFILQRAKMEAVAHKMPTMTSSNSMAQAMEGVAKDMAAMNRQMKLPQIEKIRTEFEKEAGIMDVREEANDAIDDAAGEEDDKEETDAAVSQVLDELGLTPTDELSNLPATGGSLSVAGAKKGEPTAALADADADLEERLNNLRRD